MISVVLDAAEGVRSSLIEHYGLSVPLWSSALVISRLNEGVLERHGAANAVLLSTVID